MRDYNPKQNNIEKTKNSNKSSSQNKSKLCHQENKFITHRINRKGLVEIKDAQIKSNFCNKIEYPKDKETDDLNKSIKEDNLKKILSFNYDKKSKTNSVSQDLITKILEINKKKYSFGSNTSNFFLYQKEDGSPNNNNSIKSNKISFNNNPFFIEFKEESKTSNKKNGNNKTQEIIPRIKNNNTKQLISKNKKNIYAIYASGTQDFRKHRNIKLDSASSFTDNQVSEYKYSSSISNKLKSHLKKASIFFDLHQLSESSSNQQSTFRLFSQNNLLKSPISQRPNFKNSNNENKYSMLNRQITQSIIELDLNKLENELYEYENTDITDAINKLPIHHFDSDKNNSNNKNKYTTKHFKTKNKNRLNNVREKFRILRRVRYVYDSLDDEECEDEKDNNFYFKPDGNYILILDFIILVTSLLNLVFLPIYLSVLPFNKKNLIEDFIFIFTDIIFIIDLISGFFKAYINFDENLIKNNVSIIQNYLKTWFLLDFLCGIPVYSILNELKNKSENNNYYKNCYFDYSGRNLYSLFEMIKLLKLIKVFKDNVARKKIKQKIKKINFFYYREDFIKQVFIFISILNLSSCLFIFSARNNYPNWIINTKMNIHNYISIYICSFYYIITTITTVGYGDIEICSMGERIFEILFLIIGTCLYSWMLTSASNYIKKMNEKNIKFEQKLEILNEIKANYPLMSSDLYRRLYKLLYYKKCHREVDKNIIINSLPYSIRNDLLIQMYFPIISNFKFFSYFGNSEFIIEIVSVLKPLVGIKGDLLINEGDYVEDIIFNKSGILSLEIFIDLNNPYEYIEQYLNKYNLESAKNKKNLDNNIEFSSTCFNNSLVSSYYSKNSFNFNKMNNNSIKSNNNMNFSMSIKNEKSIFDKEIINQKKFHYLKIINIRQKEHFGDVLMFLNEPSPLNVRVKSKNVEVLLLSKTDVVEISSNFPNIWGKINEKTVFNLEQIKNLIMRKLSIFCYSNDIKIKSLYYKDPKTGENKIKYSLIPIPDLNQEVKLNQNSNLNENNESKFKNSENYSSRNFENSNEKNTFIIKEVQSSEESVSNSIIRYSYLNNTMSKKGTSKKLNDSINILMQKKFGTDKNIHHIKNNKYSDVNIRENQNQFLTFSRTQSNIPYKKNYVFSTKYTKIPKKPTLFKNNTNVDNTITYGNKSSKNLKNSYLSESNDFNNSNICFSKGTKYKNVIEKSKTNQKLSSIPLFNLMQNFNINSSNSETENVNDEIYPNENFEIKIPNKVRNIINNNNDSHENSFSNCPKSSKKLLISDKKIPEINNIKEEEKHNDVNDNLNSNTKFNNLKISSMLKFEIKSSYDNINEFTKYRFISDISLIKRTKIFLSKECGLLNDLYTKSTNISYQSPILDKKAKSKSTLKLSKCLHNRQIYDYTNGINNLSVVNDNINSPPLFPKELKKLLFKKTKKDNETSNSLKDIRGSDFVQIKRNTTIKEKNVPLNKINSTCINMFSSFSPKKRKRQTEISSDNVVNIKTRNKLDLITENLKRDSQNLNNPNEFYADLFNNFYKQNMKKKKNPVSMPKIKVKQNGKEEKNIIENEEKNEENCLGDS